MTPRDHSHPAGRGRRDDDQSVQALTAADPVPRTPLTPEQASAVASASWAIAARDAAIENGDATAAARLDGLATGAIHEAGGTGVDRHRLAVELDYPGGADVMLDPPELGDPDFRPRPDLAFDPTLAATTLEEATRWLTARIGDPKHAEHILTGYRDGVRAADPTSDGWVGSLSPHELEYLAQGGARPDEDLDDALRRIEQTEPEDLIPVDLDSPIAYQLADPADEYAPDEMAAGDGFAAAEESDMALWAPVDFHDEVVSSRTAAQRLVERGLTDDEAAAAVTAYLDDLSADVGVDMHRWGLDSNDVAALSRAEQAGRADATPATVPQPRMSPESDEGARRAQLAQWHADDRRAGSTAATDAVDGGE